MILQALYNCYDLLEKDENYIVPQKGYSFVICSYTLVINAQGLVESVTPLGDEKSGQKF